jgi:hypothetical protein
VGQAGAVKNLKVIYRLRYGWALPSAPAPPPRQLTVAEEWARVQQACPLPDLLTTDAF